MALTRLFVVLLLAQPIAAAAGAPAARAPATPMSDELTPIVVDAVRKTQARFPAAGLKDEDVAITLIDLREPDRPRAGDFRGEEPNYPASVVKLFYLVA